MAREALRALMAANQNDQEEDWCRLDSMKDRIGNQQFVSSLQATTAF